MSRPHRGPAALFRTLAVVLLVAACAAPTAAPRSELGDFRLGHNYVAALDTTKGPFSRDATSAELEAALADAIVARLGRYDGEGLYHLGISIGGYVLAQPGLPLVYTPKSVLIFDVTVYDNATQTKLNDEPHRITAFEGLENTAPVIGSGNARDGSAQLANLAIQGAAQLERWLATNPDWFVPDPETPRTPFDRRAETARLVAVSGRQRASSGAPPVVLPGRSPAPEAAIPSTAGLVQPGAVAAALQPVIQPPA